MTKNPVHRVYRDVPAKTPSPAPTEEGVWVLELPFTVPMSLNDREHWAAKAKNVKAWRHATWALAHQHKIPPCRRITVELYYTPPREPRGHRRDPLNLVATLKACEDGLVDAHVIADDSTRYHTSVMPQITSPGPVRPARNRLWLVVRACQ